MNDSGFESSSIRQLILRITGINVLSIKNHEEYILNHVENPLLLIHFTSFTYPEKIYQMTISQTELNELCESDLTVFKDYFEKFIAIQVN